MTRLIAFILMTLPIELLAQDERFLAQKLFGQNDQFSGIAADQSIHWQTASDRYFIDLNQDGNNELIRIIKRDGKDQILVFGSDKKVLLQANFEGKGPGALIQKLSVKSLSKEFGIVIAHYFEGIVDYINYRATTRLYWWVYPKKDMEKGLFQQGPTIFEERHPQFSEYGRRPYLVETLDLNQDGKKEMVISMGPISRTYWLNGNKLSDDL